MTLHDQIAADVSAVFVNENDFGISVVYQIGQSSSQPFSAVPDRSVFQVASDFGFTNVETRDYIFEPSKLVVNGVTRLPDRGHKIIEDGRTYTVVNQQAIPAWIYDDIDQLLLRVHTVLVKPAS